MRQLMRWCGCGALVAGMALAATSGAAEPVYSWTTEDGVFAYSDNLKKVPARYKAKMREVEE